jgi:hypothetical protein
VAWPPAGFAPYPVVYPQWSFALSKADLSTATVTVKSNGMNAAVTTQRYVEGYSRQCRSIHDHERSRHALLSGSNALS